MHQANLTLLRLHEQAAALSDLAPLESQSGQPRLVSRLDLMEGVKLPAGEVYGYTEGGNGELGFYLVSDGSGTPYRVRIRPPCFFTTSGVERMIRGQLLADVVPCFGSINMVGGECDH